MKVNVMAAAATAVPATVQTKVSALVTPRTSVPVTPAVSTHVAVPPPVSVLALVDTTALKYLCGRAMVIFPPMGTAVTVVNPRVTVPVLTVPGILSPAVVKARSTLVVSWSPRATVAAVARRLTPHPSLRHREVPCQGRCC